MSASAEEPRTTCRKCGALLQRVGHLAGQCVACLLEPAFDGEDVPKASAERFDHYQVATHSDGTPVELGRGAMGVTFKAFDVVLGNDVALKVLAVAVTPDGHRAVSASEDRTLWLWDLESGKEIATFTGESGMGGCAVTSDGRTIVVGESSGQVHFLQLVEADETKLLPGEIKIPLLFQERQPTNKTEE